MLTLNRDTGANPGVSPPHRNTDSQASGVIADSLWNQAQAVFGWCDDRHARILPGGWVRWQLLVRSSTRRCGHTLECGDLSPLSLPERLVAQTEPRRAARRVTITPS